MLEHEGKLVLGVKVSLSSLGDFAALKSGSTFTTLQTTSSLTFLNHSSNLTHDLQINPSSMSSNFSSACSLLTKSFNVCNVVCMVALESSLLCFFSA